MGQGNDQGVAGGGGTPLPDEIAADNAEQGGAWNGDDGRYWVQHRERQEARYRRLTPHLMAAAGIQADSRVLDIGCGSGGTSLEAARAAAEGAVLGVDVSAPMLAEARKQAAGSGLPQVTFERGDAQVHLFEDGAFDIAISRFGVMFFADPEAAFANIARALRPGGQLAFLCWRSVRDNPYLTVPMGAIAPYVQLPELEAPGAPGPFSLVDTDRIEKLLDSAGFDEITISAVDEPMWMGTDPDDVVAYQLGIPASRAMLAEASAEARAKTETALRDALAEHQGPDGVTLGSAAWLVTARRR
ncbi:Methylase involved in ubiquinone/menaquinone biosynthesis [Streptomyces sp. SceaMP-e96]|uniref:class I SAM-dependent methyltransferase n=1 Tax=unclassified Streptomyces TaxID=2593676 RepID=UPI000823E3DA|nr:MULTISPECIES: class I SAM-dependent methyltransferase [unclassified Streptomyces]SCK59895.1 Methylase involved in ubiquinone/menaquinone biosynthesis [Streptomyces sp. SceaMP-e96]